MRRVPEKDRETGMKKIIEKLEKTVKTLEEACCQTAPRGLTVITALNLVREALAELKSRPRWESVDRDHRVKCNRCGFVFYGEVIRVDEAEGEEQCPICGATGYLMDMPKLKEKPRRETPELLG
jgi:rubredoxin